MGHHLKQCLCQINEPLIRPPFGKLSRNGHYWAGCMVKSDCDFFLLLECSVFRSPLQYDISNPRFHVCNRASQDPARPGQVQDPASRHSGSGLKNLNEDKHRGRQRSRVQAGEHQTSADRGPDSRFVKLIFKPLILKSSRSLIMITLNYVHMNHNFQT